MRCLPPLAMAFTLPALICGRISGVETKAMFICCAEERRDHRTAALVGDMGHAHAGGLLEEQRAQMIGAAVAGAWHT